LAKLEKPKSSIKPEVEPVIAVSGESTIRQSMEEEKVQVKEDTKYFNLIIK
jgi:hypothetical protein